MEHWQSDMSYFSRDVSVMLEDSMADDYDKVSFPSLSFSSLLYKPAACYVMAK